MLQVTKITVRSFDLDHLDISWEINNIPYGANPDTSQHQIYDYNFFVMRSEGVAGPWALISGPLRDPRYSFRDVNVSLLTKFRTYYYKIRVVHVPSGETQDFGLVPSTEAPPDLIAANIISLEDTLFREFIGRKCWTFPIRTFGPYCSCFDRVLGRKTTGRHLPCFGTGWLGGFLAPIECYVQIDPTTSDSQLSSLQEMQINTANARLISFPPMSPRDILVESENRRWRVVSVRCTERLRSLVHQELVLHEIPRGDVEYALPINVDAQTIEPAAERNFSNPQTLTNDGEYTRALTSVYGKVF